MDAKKLTKEIKAVGYKWPEGYGNHQKRWVVVCAYRMYVNGSLDNVHDDLVAVGDVNLFGKVPSFEGLNGPDQMARLLFSDGFFKKPFKFPMADGPKTICYDPKDKFGDDDEDDSEPAAGDNSPSISPPTQINKGLLTNHLVVTPVDDLSKLSMETVYGYVTRAMSDDIKAVFNKILEANQNDRVNLCWALFMSKAAMMTKAMTPAEIAKAASLPFEQQIDPYEYYTVLADTIVTKVLALKGVEIYIDPGERDGQVYICKIGAVINHTKHNVAFGGEENIYQLTQFVKIYESTHPEIVKAMQAKMEMLPKEPISGVFMKYRPKRKVYFDELKRQKDYNRFIVTINKHGSYQQIDFDFGHETDLLTLAMTSLAPSPLALYSLMARTPNSSEVLKKFDALASKRLEPVSAAEITGYYNFCENATYGTGLIDADMDLYGALQLDDSFSTTLINNVVPVIAKDKGIYNSLMRILQPYGSVTLQIAVALYHYDPLFANNYWVSFNSADVVRQLHLRVVACDNLSAPNRAGMSEAHTSEAKIVVSRGFTKSATTVTYNPPDYALILKQAPKGKCLIDLSWNCRLYSITDEKAYERHRQQGKFTHQDKFAHDASDSVYSSCGLFTGTGDATKAAWELFVVVMPIKHLKAAFCKKLFSFYHVSAFPGGLGQNFSVYLIGAAKVPNNKPDQANNFPFVCATMLFKRLQLYQQLYSGYPDDVRTILTSQHAVLARSKYVETRAALANDVEFTAAFTKKVATTMSVVQGYKPMGKLQNLTITTDLTDDADFGVEMG
jgi:hypothetical protein